MEPGEDGCHQVGVTISCTMKAKWGGRCPAPKNQQPCTTWGDTWGASPSSFPAQLVAVEAGLQAGGDTVGALVALLDPPPALAVLDADGGDACKTRRGSAPATPGCRAVFLLHPWVHPGVPWHTLLPATTPPSRSTSWMAARMVPPVSTHWSTRRMRRPGEGQRLWLSAWCPCWPSPLHNGSVPLAHLERWCQCGPPSPSPGLSSRCRAAPESARRGAQLCGWPGSLSSVWWQQQRLGEGHGTVRPCEAEGRGPWAHPHPCSPRMKPMASMPATMSMGSPWKGCSRSATQSCKP